MPSPPDRKLPAETYIELSFFYEPGDSGAKRASHQILSQLGFLNPEIVHFETKEYGCLAGYTRARGIELRAKEKARGLPPAVRFKSRTLGRKDWLDKWQADYRMQPLGKKLMLVPMWQRAQFEKKRARSNRLPVFLDPKSVFGSGTHASTRLILGMIESLAGRFESFLDLGTGTGILSCAAGRLGAKKILAVDHDIQAVRTARANLELNDLVGRAFRKELKTAAPFRPQFDLVAANLFTSLLLAARKTIFESVRPGGHLAVSGIYVSNLPELKREFKYPGFRCLKVYTRENWAGLLFKRD